MVNISLIVYFRNILQVSKCFQISIALSIALPLQEYVHALKYEMPFFLCGAIFLQFILRKMLPLSKWNMKKILLQPKHNKLLYFRVFQN